MQSLPYIASDDEYRDIESFVLSAAKNASKHMVPDVFYDVDYKLNRSNGFLYMYHGEMFGVYDVLDRLTHVVAMVDATDWIGRCNQRTVVVDMRDPRKICAINPLYYPFSPPKGAEIRKANRLQEMMYRAIVSYTDYAPYTAIMGNGIDDIQHGFKLSDDSFYHLFYYHMPSVAGVYHYRDCDNDVHMIYIRLKFRNTKSEAIAMLEVKGVSSSYIEENVNIAVRKYAAGMPSLNDMSNMFVASSLKNIRIYTNVCNLFVKYALCIGILKDIFFHHRIVRIQRLWRKWWYEPNAEGYVRFASRMYDKDSA